MQLAWHRRTRVIDDDKSLLRLSTWPYLADVTQVSSQVFRLTAAPAHALAYTMRPFSSS